MIQSHGLAGVIVSPDDADVIAVYMLLSQRVETSIKCTYVTHVGEIDLRAYCDFVLVGALQHVAAVIRLYDMAHQNVPHIIHLVDELEDNTVDYTREFPTAEISAFPMPQLDTMESTLKFDEFIDLMESLQQRQAGTF
jgi:hypothetical protein